MGVGEGRPLRLGVTDQSPIASGRTAADALAETVELARLTERLGYHRYWLAEHHGSDSFAGCSPEIMIGQVAAATRRIRVGSGGVMLMHYSPLKVAENFKLLQTLFPDRIDLGIGRAPGSDGVTAAALAYGSNIGVAYMPTKIADLKAFLTGAEPHTQALQTVNPAPSVSPPPELWMLGSTTEGARIAAHFGLPFSYAHFINPDELAAACDLYRAEFRPSDHAAEPRVCLGIFALCADTEAEADALAQCRDWWRVELERGRFRPFPSLAEVQARPLSEADQTRMNLRHRHQVLGVPARVKAGIEALVETVQADEVTLVSITHAFRDRVRCYELIAEAFALTPEPAS